MGKSTVTQLKEGKICLIEIERHKITADLKVTIFCSKIYRNFRYFPLSDSFRPLLDAVIYNQFTTSTVFNKFRENCVFSFSRSPSCDNSHEYNR